MYWITSGIENPSKSEVIGPCGGDENTEWPRRTDNGRIYAMYRLSITDAQLLQVWVLQVIRTSEEYCFKIKLIDQHLQSALLSTLHC